MANHSEVHTGSDPAAVCSAHGPTMEALQKVQAGVSTLQSDVAWSNRVGKGILVITGSTLALLFPLTLSLGVFLSDVRTQLKIHDMSIRRMEIQLEKIEHDLDRLDQASQSRFRLKKSITNDSYGKQGKDSDFIDE